MTTMAIVLAIGDQVGVLVKVVAMLKKIDNKDNNDDVVKT